MIRAAGKIPSAREKKGSEPELGWWKQKLGLQSVETELGRCGGRARPTIGPTRERSSGARSTEVELGRR
ncbi:hypothetical protein GUJ93_ZPchr0012g21330 [Zizania palustris]|uniref:Uncharacterized protein n=1 Tax=Zizania palustris TaxID=103762 RepID=A0A8J5WTP6_ZIZPA|nr:hypothetical protein GUJ93_ZPchr0012g21330 [Zizania palustris]